MSRQRKIEGTTLTTAPSRLLTVAYDPIDVPCGNGGYHTRTQSWSLELWRRRGNTWAKVRESCRTGTTTMSALATVLESSENSGRTYVVSLNPADCWTLLGLWRSVDEGRVSLRLTSHSAGCAKGGGRKKRRHPLILGGVPEVIGYSVGRGEGRWVAYGNHFPSPLTEAAGHAGYPACPAVRAVNRPTGHAFPDSSWTAGALSAVYRRLISWWLENRCGRWRDTQGAAAWSWWQTTIKTGDIHEHDLPQAVGSERAAVYGGRAQVFWFGSAGAGAPGRAPDATPEPAVPLHRVGRCWKYDFRSMYATLLRDGTFPVKLLHRVRLKSPEELHRAMKSVLVVATVRVRCRRPLLPFRVPPKGAAYPVGEWVATYSTPDLRTALDSGCVMAVHDCWSYLPGRPFAAFASRLIGLREKAVAEGDKVGGTYCKVLANCLGGKLARTGRGWQSEPDKVCRERWGEWHEINADTREIARLRGIAGVRQRMVEKNDSPGCLTAAYAHLTAYGRVKLQAVIDAAGESNVLWCDTDGLLVTDAGRDRIESTAGLVGCEPGQLRAEGEVFDWCARTPKHYVAGGVWTLAGFRGDFGAVSDGYVKHYQTVNPSRAGQLGDGQGVPTACTVTRLDEIPLSGRPGADGWLIPPEVVAGRLVQPTDELPDLPGE